jgi:hypothetical protein
MQGGRFVDPSRQKFERSQPLEGDGRQRFLEAIKRVRDELLGGRLASRVRMNETPES